MDQEDKADSNCRRRRSRRPAQISDRDAGPALDTALTPDASVPLRTSRGASDGARHAGSTRSQSQNRHRPSHHPHTLSSLPAHLERSGLKGCCCCWDQGRCRAGRSDRVYNALRAGSMRQAPTTAAAAGGSWAELVGAARTLCCRPPQKPESGGLRAEIGRRSAACIGRSGA